VLVTGCNVHPAIEDNSIATDQDFEALVYHVSGKLMETEPTMNKSDHDWMYIYSLLVQDPVIRDLSLELRRRYPDLDVDNASRALDDFLSRLNVIASSDPSSSSFDMPTLVSLFARSDSDYYLCLASVASMGVIMMAGCSTLGPLAVPCGAAVASWVAIESAACHMDATDVEL
jgi:hypothetical protein